MLVGLFLSHVLPELSQAIDGLQFAGISIPIGVCLFLMMYPALLNLQFGELKKLAKNPKPIILTILSNWIWAPLITALLAYYFLAGHDQLIVSLILLGSSPCTAMVLVWGSLANGNQEQNVVNTTLNTITIMFLYAPVVSLLTGIRNIQIDRLSLLLAVFVFIGIPMVLGVISKRALTNKKGAEWFKHSYRPAVNKISIFALLATLVVIFSLNGNVLIMNPEEMVLVSVPLLLGFFIVVGINLLVTKIAGLRYKEGIISVIIGSSSHFEIAIATAISLYGLGSQAALGTTMGLFWEVPVMLSLVYLGKNLGKRGFWKTDKKVNEMEDKKVKEYVKKRYGEIAQKECSSCSTSCCSSTSCGTPPQYVAWKIGYSPDDIESVPEESVLGLGCGNPVALASLKEGETVLDLGSGGGIDAFLASKKVGPNGKVIGVDMTDEMLQRATKTASKHGYTNVEFRLGEIENLPFEDNSVDVIISNCVINLAPDKLKVFKEAYRVLKPDGRLMVSDLVTSGELPDEIRKSFDAWAGCIAGALEKSDYLNKIAEAGFKNVKIASQKPYTIDLAPQLRGKIVSIQIEAHKT